MKEKKERITSASTCDGKVYKLLVSQSVRASTLSRKSMHALHTKPFSCTLSLLQFPVSSIRLVTSIDSLTKPSLPLRHFDRYNVNDFEYRVIYITRWDVIVYDFLRAFIDLKALNEETCYLNRSFKEMIRNKNVGVIFSLLQILIRCRFLFSFALADFKMSKYVERQDIGNI